MLTLALTLPGHKTKGKLTQVHNVVLLISKYLEWNLADDSEDKVAPLNGSGLGMWCTVQSTTTARLSRLEPGVKNSDLYLDRRQALLE